MIKRKKNDFDESYSSNLVILREHHFQRDSVEKMNMNFENALFLSTHLKI